MRTQRTDIHRPSVINPADYELVSYDYYGGGIEAAAFVPERLAFRDHMQHTGGKFAQSDHAGTCYICGANALWVAKFHHVPTNTYIVTGMECASKMGLDTDGTEFRSFQKRVKAGLEAAAGKAKARAQLAEHGLSEVEAIYTDADTMHCTWAVSTLRDLYAKLVRYGALSDKQWSFLASLLERIHHEAVIEAERKAEAERAAPIPVSGQRITVVGKVLAVKAPNPDDLYPTSKMLVQHADGWKVWGTHVIGERGDTVEFVARVTSSDNDPKFGFFSRPTKARVLEAAVAA